MVEFPVEIVEMYKDFKPAHMKIYRIIKDSIYSGKLQTREKFTEEAIAKALGCSRTPVRTALQKLQADGLLQNITRNNYGLKFFNEKDIKDLLELDQLLEGRAAFLVAQNGISEDDLETLEELNDMLASYTDASSGSGAKDLHAEFHLMIAKFCNNVYLYREIVNVRNQMRTLSTVDSSYTDVITPLHRDLLNAIRNRDPLKAELLIRYEIDHGHTIYRSVNEQ